MKCFKMYPYDFVQRTLETFDSYFTEDKLVFAEKKILGPGKRPVKGLKPGDSLEFDLIVTNEDPELFSREIDILDSVTKDLRLNSNLFLYLD